MMIVVVVIVEVERFVTIWIQNFTSLRLLSYFALSLLSLVLLSAFSTEYYSPYIFSYLPTKKLILLVHLSKIYACPWLMKSSHRPRTFTAPRVWVSRYWELCQSLSLSSPCNRWHLAILSVSIYSLRERWDFWTALSELLSSSPDTM